MIIDKIENIEIYKNLNSKIAKSLEYLKNTDFSKIENGRYDLEEDVFAIVQEYNSKPLENNKLEAHKVYTDIQYIAEGCEKIGYETLDKLTISEEYDEKRDILFYKEQGELFTINKGMFAIFFPQDAHMPGIRVNEPIKVKKIVIKIKL